MTLPAAIVVFSPTRHEQSPELTQYFNNPVGGTAIAGNVFIEASRIADDDRALLEADQNCVRVGLRTSGGSLIVRIDEDGELVARRYGITTQLHLEARRIASDWPHERPGRDLSMFRRCEVVARTVAALV